MKRLEHTFSSLRDAQRTGLVTYFMAGDGGLETTNQLLKDLPGAGADIIELGMPFTDPMADGPTIQRAALRSLKSGTKMGHTLDAVAQFRETNQTTPIVLMGYFNPIFIYGESRFIDDAASAGVDGLIIVDLPPEEDETLRTKASEAGISIIRLTTPTTDDQRLPTVLDGASGFVYHVSVKGITGGQSADMQSVADNIATIRQHTHLPVAIGFGISTGEQAKSMANYADAVVVGSALVKHLENDPRPDLLLDHVRMLRGALDR